MVEEEARVESRTSDDAGFQWWEEASSESTALEAAVRNDDAWDGVKGGQE